MELEEESAPILLELVGSIAFVTGQVLVTRCGTGHDVFALAAPESFVTGLDARPALVDRFEAQRVDRGIPRSFVRFVAADFLVWEADRAFDLVWDAALLAQIRPAERPQWAARLAAVVAPGGELAVLLHPIAPVGSSSAPPHAVDPNAIAALLAEDFDCRLLAPVARSHPNRQGHEWIGRWKRRRAADLDRDANALP